MKTEYMFNNGQVSVYCNRRTYKGFEPYFYVKANAYIPNLPKIVRVMNTNKLNLYDDKLRMIVTRTPYDVKKIRDKFDWTGEADIRFTKRFNIDKKIKQHNEVKLFLDIEEKVPPDGDPDKTGMYPITIIGIYNKFNDTYHQWVQHPKLFLKSISVKWENRLTKHISKRVIHQFNDERLILLDYISYMAYHKPDMLIEWSNKSSFDFTNIIERMKKNKINYNSLSPIGRVSNDKYVDIGAIETTNMLHYYKKHHIGELHSFALDTVCEKEFGIGKLYKIDDYEKEWNENLVGLLDYNICDVELMVNLDNHTKLFDNIQYIIDGIGCEFEDYLSNVSIVRHYLLKKAMDYGLVLDTWKYDNIISFVGYNEELFRLPEFELVEYRKEFNRGLVRINKKFKNKTEEKKFIHNINKKFSNVSLFTIKGAYVVEPKRGLYSNVECYDYRSMYPNIIIEKNMSPETLVKYEDRHKYKPEDLHDIGNGVYFLKQHIKKGFLPRVLEELFGLRYNVKDQMKGLDKNSRKYKILDGQQTGIKYLINSFWGVMKFICIWIAESITFTGQRILRWTIDKSEELSCEVVYGDTDSIYIVNNYSGIEKRLEKVLMKELKKELGMNIELEYEGYFPRALFLTKKRYVLERKEYSNKNDKYKYRGLEIVRSNESEFNKELQKKSIDMLFEGKNENDVIKYMQTEIKDIENKKPTFVARPTRLNFSRKTKTGITKYEIAARASNRILNKRYDTGDKPYYLPGICFDYNEEVQITDSMIPELKDEVYKKLSNLFDALGWDIKELKSEYKIRKYDI